MAVFSIYAGLLYNEFLSVPLNLFGTNWEIDPEGDGRHYRLIDMDRTYPFGVDPVWKVGIVIGLLFDECKYSFHNKAEFLNSTLKTKKIDDKKLDLVRKRTLMNSL